MSKKILIIDDDKDIVSLITDILEDEGFEVGSVYNGQDAINKISEEDFNLIILDIMLPDFDGFEVLRRIKSVSDTPVLFLSAKNKNTDKVIGLELGAEDYITKPFNDDELIARVKVQLRKQNRLTDTTKENINIIKYKNIEINKNSFEVKVYDNKVDLSTREFEILLYLTEHPNVVLTREQIFSDVWGKDWYGDINTVTVHIKKLREKIDINDEFIKTVWGVGYKFVGERV